MEPRVDRDHFRKSFPSSALFGKKLTDARWSGFTAVFDHWDSIESYDSLEWLSYELATAWHETGGLMLPVREGFAASDAEAYDRVTAYCKAHGIFNYATRHQNGHSYYGRGYIQLTHGENYKKMGKALGLGDALYDDPDRVLVPQTGARILIHGMMDGLFRPSKGGLSDYFNGANHDWFGARDIVNGDKDKRPKWLGGVSIGEAIAAYGKAFRGALRYDD